MLGLYLWYFVLSLRDVEWELLVRRHPFKLAHVPYLVGRYTHLMAAVGIADDALGEMQGRAAHSGRHLVCACRIRDRACVQRPAPSVLRRSTDERARAVGIAAVTVRVDPIAHVCLIKATPGPLLAFFIFTFVWDVVIMALTLWGIHLDRTYVEAATPLKDALVRQGVGYAVVTTLTCVPMAVVYALQLNEVMNVFLIPVGACSARSCETPF
ncbi:hypothetical protein PHLGIDRAFT_333445 [Phlebiopsis gigantea 11061_1 CR5-6]|uniref:Uncharacterized protein n=1 Tax=Phlebiopsis gigantea (strain 11061_1 CR5-6) TaxID=745531 RepID=A0A0C3SAM6_PHLG1|nr:hypothetical protein PHLGIDRAFT_333445 [Phlebiopsis gigantea 11061_1 CR5-6]